MSGLSWRLLNNTKIMTFLYFGYGSNLLRERLRLENPSAVFLTTAVLEDHTLTFSSFGHDPEQNQWRGGAASIIEAPGRSLWGCVWRLENQHMASLDWQENIYNAKEVNVKAPDGTEHTCRTYQLPAKLLANQEYDNRPSPAYMDVIIRGALQNELPPQYINYLKTIETNGSPEQPEVYLRTLSLVRNTD